MNGRTSNDPVDGNEPEIRRPNAARAHLILDAAKRYFVDDQSRASIGQDLGISRFKVARLLNEARRMGYVQITIASPDGYDHRRSTDLAAAWRLDRAIVVPAPDQAELQATFAEAIASYLTENVREDDVVGLPAGRTAGRAVRLLDHLPPCTVVQITGVSSMVELSDSPVETIRRVAQVTSGRAYALFGPLVLDDEAAAASLRSQPGIAETLGMFPRLTKAVVSLAPWHKGDSAFYDSASPRDQRLMTEDGAVAEILGNVLRSDGSQTSSAFTERCLTLSLSELARIPDLIGVGGGSHRRAALLAILRANVLNTLITDSDTADFLIRASGSSDPR